MYEIEKLNKKHKKKEFDCGNNFLNEFLKKYALQNQNRYYIGTTYIISDNENNIISYITISVITIKKVELEENYPYDELPAILIARLAVDKKYQNNKIGEELLVFAIKKALKLSEEIGCIGIVVDAKPEAYQFYKNYDFEEIKSFYPSITKKMFLSIKTIKKALNKT